MRTCAAMNLSAARAPDWPRLMTVELAAVYLSMSRDSFERLVAAGALTPLRPFDSIPLPGRQERKRPSDPRFDREHLDAFVDGLGGAAERVREVAEAIVRGEPLPGRGRARGGRA